MKKLTLLLAALSLIVGALFLSACSEPMGSETDDGLAVDGDPDPTHGNISGRVEYLVNGNWIPIALGVMPGDSLTLSGPSSGSTTSNSNGSFNFGSRPFGNGYTISASATRSGTYYAGSTNFNHTYSQFTPGTFVVVKLYPVSP